MGIFSGLMASGRNWTTGRVETPPVSTGYDETVEGSSAFGNLIVWAKLGGSPIVDTQGNIANGTETNIGFVSSEMPDVGDIAADFDGSTSNISWVDDVDLHLAELAIHIAVDIVTMPDIGAFRQILTKEGAGLVDQDFVLGLFNSAGAHEIRFQIVQTSSVIRLIAPITLGKHWITVNLGNAVNMEMFVDAISLSTAAYTGGIDANTNGMVIGAADFGAGPVEFFSGQLKHLQIYNRRLTSGEIAVLSPSLPESEPPPPPPPPPNPQNLTSMAPANLTDMANAVLTDY